MCGFSECERQVVCGVGLCTVGIPTLMICGVILLERTSPRQEQLAHYDMAVLQWTATGYAEFAGVLTRKLVGNNRSRALVPVSVADPFYDKGNDVAKYSVYLHYSVNTPSDVTYPGSLYSTLQVASARGPLCALQFPAELPLKGHEYYEHIDAEDCGATCSIGGGVVVDSENTSCTCSYTTYLTEYCVIVSINRSSNKITLTDMYHGCYNGAEAWGKYTLLPSPPRAITFIVRSDKDPFLLAQRITNDSLQFAEGDTTQITAGAFLFLVGLLCVMPCACCLCTLNGQEGMKVLPNLYRVPSVSRDQYKSYGTVSPAPLTLPAEQLTRCQVAACPVGHCAVFSKI